MPTKVATIHPVDQEGAYPDPYSADEWHDSRQPGGRQAQAVWLDTREYRDGRHDSSEYREEWHEGHIAQSEYAREEWQGVAPVRTDPGRYRRKGEARKGYDYEYWEEDYRREDWEEDYRPARENRPTYWEDDYLPAREGEREGYKGEYTQKGYWPRPKGQKGREDFSGGGEGKGSSVGSHEPDWDYGGYGRKAWSHGQDGRRIAPRTSPPKPQTEWPDGATTVAVRNLPNGLDSDTFVGILRDLNVEQYLNFVYTPYVPCSLSNRDRGYAFINVKDRGFVEHVQQALGKRFRRPMVQPAQHQGLIENLRHLAIKQPRAWNAYTSVAWVLHQEKLQPMLPADALVALGVVLEKADNGPDSVVDFRSEDKTRVLA